MALLAINLEIQEDLQELRDLGLTEEEIVGYMEYFADNYFGEGDDIRVPMPEVQDNSREMA